MAGFTEISLLNFTNFRDTTARRFLDGEGLVQDLEAVKSLYKKATIVRGTGDRRIFNEIDTQTYASYKAEGTDAAKKAVIDGYSKTMIARRYAAEIDITFEARTFGKNQEIIQKLTSLATFIPQRMAIDLTHRFTFYAETAYTDMDGESIDVTMGDTLAGAHAAHTLSSGLDTYSSIITGNPVFSATALETAKGQANTQIMSNFGERRVMDFNTVVISDDPATVRTARELLNSTGAPDGAHSGVSNFFAGMFKLVILPRLATDAQGGYDSTKAKQWHYVAAGQWEAYVAEWEANNLKSPSAGNNGENLHNDNWTFGARGTRGIVVVSAKGNLMSDGTGS